MKNRIIVAAGLALIMAASCTKEEPTIVPVASNLRATIDYSKISNNTPYKSLFIDSIGDTTVDLSAGNARIDIFRALDAYGKLPNPNGSTAVLQASVLSNMYSNTAAPYSGTYAYLNTSTEQLRNKTGVSQSNAEQVRQKIESFFPKLAAASNSVTQVAEEGKAGKLGTYLVDENGVEWIQMIAKSLIGSYQLDYICNVLLSDNSLNTADNSKLVAGKKYTELEHVWDEAYATLTPNKVYLDSATDAKRGTEYFIGTYVWEYNKAGYPKIHPAFLKGRAAIVNNDRIVAKQQALIIRTEFEKAIAAAARGYLQKVKDGAATPSPRAHAYGEGIGFIYSLRFCLLNGGTAAFSDEILNDINFNTTGIWKLTNAQVDAASEKIRVKFGL